MKKAILFLCFFTSLGLSVYAQSEAETAMKEAMDAYKNQKWTAAYSSLQTALVEINNKIAEEIMTVFPAVQKGWKEENANSLNASGMGMLGGGTGAEKSYSFEEGDQYSSIKITITTNSPMISSMLMVINNPMMAGNMGKTIKINGEKAIEKFDADSQSDEINMVLDGKTLITISASGIKDKAVVLAYAQAIDLKKLRTILSE